MGDLNLELAPQQNPPANPDHQDDEENNQETMTCQICIEPVNNKLFKNNNGCDHPFCTDCLIKYIQVKLEENVSDIKCPAMNCSHSLEPLLCRSKITPQLFEKWCDTLCESTVLGVDSVYCPNRECSGLVLNECGEGYLKKLMCPYCKKPFCFRCKVPWHAGSACSGATRDENDVAFDAVCKMNKWKSCPNCGHCIERVDGCIMVTCRFCYKCGKRHECLQMAGGMVLCLMLYVFVWFVIFLICAGGPRKLLDLAKHI